MIPVIIWSYCVKKTPLLACEILLLSGLTNLADGYREVWGKPDTSENSTACWKLGNDTTLVVSYKNNGIVAICGLKDDSGASIGE